MAEVRAVDDNEQPNRRAAERKALNTSAKVMLASGDRDVRLRDLGIDGAALVSARPIGQGSKIRLGFTLWTPQGQRAIEVNAKVVYSSYVSKDEFKVGAVFTALPPDAAAAIRDYLD